jgi:chromosome segregation ATPase
MSIQGIHKSFGSFGSTIGSTIGKTKKTVYETAGILWEKVRVIARRIFEIVCPPARRARELNVKFTEVTKERDELANKVNSLETKINENTGVYAHSSTELANQLKKTQLDLDQARSLRKGVDAQLALSKQENARKEEEIGKLAAQVAQKTTEIEGLVRDLEESHERAGSFERELRTRTTELEKTKENIKQTLLERDQQISDALESKEKVAAAGRDALQKLKDEKANVKTLQEKTVELNDTIIDLKEKLEDANRRAGQHQHDVDETKPRSGKRSSVSPRPRGRTGKT